MELGRQATQAFGLPIQLTHPGLHPTHTPFTSKNPSAQVHLFPFKTLLGGQEEQTSGLDEHLSQVGSRHGAQDNDCPLKYVPKGHPHDPVDGS